jgi:hypothetical protein
MTVSTYHEQQIVCEWKQTGYFKEFKIRSVGFEVLTATSIKMATFWDVAQRTLVEIAEGPDDGGSKHL